MKLTEKKQVKKNDKIETYISGFGNRKLLLVFGAKLPKKQSRSSLHHLLKCVLPCSLISFLFLVSLSSFQQILQNSNSFFFCLFVPKNTI